MTLHVSLVGIDGSGKRSLAQALPALLAAEHGLRVGAAGVCFTVVDPDQDRLAAGFAPDGLPASVHLARLLGRIARWVVNSVLLYPLLELLHLLLQDRAARSLAARHGVDVMVGDCHFLLGTAGRAANDLGPASAGGESPRAALDRAELLARLAFLRGERDRAPAAIARRVAWLARLLCRPLRWLGLDPLWLPDVVVLLDIEPATALERLAGAPRVVRIATDHLTPGQTLARLLEALRPSLPRRPAWVGDEAAPLGSGGSAGSPATVGRRVLSYRYLVRYLAGQLLAGAWREPLFLLSAVGRRFLREGYSAGIMSAIYSQPQDSGGPLARAFYGYPLHRAVNDRLHVIVDQLRRAIEVRLAAGASLTILSAPCGTAEDLLRALEAIAARDPAGLRRVRVVAADLDPGGDLGPTLLARAAGLDVRLCFVRGDLMRAASQARLRQEGPFDLVLFAGLSSWLPKPALVERLRWLAQSLRPGGLLLSDCFTPAAYSLSGRSMGHRATYYTPEVYRLVVDYCGFDGRRAAVHSGRDGINHLLVAPLRCERAPLPRGTAASGRQQADARRAA